jgi:rRNA-processing protein FCF1
MTQNTGDKNDELLLLSKIYPAPSTIFSVQPESLDRIKSDCLVVLDTNTLLAPFDISQQSLGVIERTYRVLITNNRLFIPAQVAREFAKNRPEKLKELHHNIAEIKSKSGSKVSMFERPFLEGLN